MSGAAIYMTVIYFCINRYINIQNSPMHYDKNIVLLFIHILIIFMVYFRYKLHTAIAQSRLSSGKQAGYQTRDRIPTQARIFVVCRIPLQTEVPVSLVFEWQQTTVVFAPNQATCKYVLVSFIFFKFDNFSNVSKARETVFPRYSINIL